MVVLDCGVKYNILGNLEARGCEVIVLPATATAAEILALAPAGVLLSNGPGDPAALSFIVETVRSLLGKVPIFGICLGHRPGPGGRGADGEAQVRPSRDQPAGAELPERPGRDHLPEPRVRVVPESLPEGRVTILDNLNDCTSEGLRYPKLMAFSVQHHPEAAPGPHEAAHLFDEFMVLMDEGRMVVRTPATC